MQKPRCEFHSNAMQKVANPKAPQSALAPDAVPVEKTHSQRPETFRLPKIGGDPFFGLTRSWYYSAEKEGTLRLIRLRQRGKLRGVVLIPYDDVARIVAAAREQESSDQKRQTEGAE